MEFVIVSFATPSFGLFLLRCVVALNRLSFLVTYCGATRSLASGIIERRGHRDSSNFTSIDRHQWAKASDLTTNLPKVNLRYAKQNTKKERRSKMKQKKASAVSMPTSSVDLLLLPIS